MQGSPNSRSIVHLVHGTFAREAEWIHPDSMMANQVRDCLGDETVIEAFKWSGANSHTARQIAGHELAEKIRKFDQGNPGKPQFIVAHSHGGNVAAYALGDGEIRSKISAVVCLGTPFILARARDLTGARRLVQWVLIACISVVLVIAFALIVEGTTSGLDPEKLQDILHYHRRHLWLALLLDLACNFSFPFARIWPR